MEIAVFDREINLLGYLDLLQTLDCVLRYAEPGSIEIQCAYTPDNHARLICGNSVGLRRDRALRWLREHGRERIASGTEREPYGRVDDAWDGFIITRVTTQTDAAGHRITVSGASLSSILGQRVLAGLYSYTGATRPAIIEALVRDTCVAPVIPERAFPALIIAAETLGGAAIDKNVSYKPLLEIVEALAAEGDTGFNIVLLPHRRRMVFYQYAGLDRSGRLPLVGRVAFDETRLGSLTHERDTGNGKTVTHVAGAGDGATRRCLWVGDTAASGFERRELAADARDISDEYTVERQVYDEELEEYVTEYVVKKYTDAEYHPKLTERGTEKLAERPDTETLTGEASDSCDLWLGVDYGLGDLVLVRQSEWGVEERQRITSVTERFDADGVYTVIPGFGSETATVIDRVLAKLI